MMHSCIITDHEKQQCNIDLENSILILYYTYNFPYIEPVLKLIL